MKINIAIDGPSAAGKSTIAKILAEKLHYAHLDTGAMYRCAAYHALHSGVNMSDEDALANMIRDMEIRFDSHGNVFVNDLDVTKQIRTNDISMHASNVSTYPKVRQELVAMQQEIAKNKGYIMDGRDIGTVVLPDAELKIYMVASTEARAQRRYKEYIEKNIVAQYDEIYRDIEKRDYQDSHRAASPLRKADDAVEIDTSNMTIDEVVEKISGLLDTIHR